MTLEELMVFSILVRKFNKECGDEEIRKKIMDDYNREILSIEFFQNVKRNMMFYGDEGYEFVNKVQEIVQKMLQAPKIHEIDELFNAIENKDAAIQYMIDSTNRKINESVFWDKNINVVDTQVDKQERKYYEALLKINRYTAVSMNPFEKIFVDIEQSNAVDMQRAYKKMLFNSNKKQKEGWVISRIQTKVDEARYRLVFYNMNEIKKYICSTNSIKYIDNLWNIEKVNSTGTRNNSSSSEKVVYCGIGRITNLCSDNFIANNEFNVIEKIEAQKGNMLLEYEKNPLKLIETYIGRDQAKYSITPEDFLWILNKRELNYRCIRRISQKKCLICGCDTRAGYVTCGYHIAKYGNW